ncbi:hypothetical protein EFD55_04785 [Rhizobium pisi]|uniref:Uncharacterized protein n=1 Tax=Rhizobium pisi TaxID=574561 RepID=A0A3R9CBF0_9HYPH|nr:hypothetical protein EFD55_04785 [Rhizobium pisi]TCA44956.1 hypothetical protein E0J16_30440 [Rhizobium pisi]
MFTQAPPVNGFVNNQLISKGNCTKGSQKFKKAGAGGAPAFLLFASAGTQGRGPSRRVFAKAPLRSGAGGRDGASLGDRFVEIEPIAVRWLIQITKK